MRANIRYSSRKKNVLCGEFEFLCQCLRADRLTLVMLRFLPLHELLVMAERDLINKCDPGEVALNVFTKHVIPRCWNPRQKRSAQLRVLYSTGVRLSIRLKQTEDTNIKFRSTQQTSSGSLYLVSLSCVCLRNKSFFGCSPLQYVVFVCVCL